MQTTTSTRADAARLAAVKAAIGALRAAGLNVPKGYDDGQQRAGIIALWAGMLSDLSPEQIGAAVLAYIAKPTSAWPSVGDIRACAVGASHEGDADIAFGSMRAAIGRHGVDDPPMDPDAPGGWTMHPDPQIAAWCARATRAVGWATVRGGGDARAAWVRAVRVEIENTTAKAMDILKRAAFGTAARATAERALELAASESPAALWSHVERAIPLHTDADAPAERVEGWTLHPDRESAGRMWVGLRALGGWPAFCRIPFNDPEHGRVNEHHARETFRRAFERATVAATHDQTRSVLQRLEGRGSLTLLIGGGA